MAKCNSINNIIFGSCLLSGFITTAPQLQATLPPTSTRDRHGRTPFHIAVLEKNLSMICQLNEQGANVETKKTRSGKVKKTADICDVYGQTPLHVATELNAKKVVKALLNIGVLLNMRTHDNQKQTALHIAVNKGNSKIVQALLDAGANPNIPDDNGLTALQHANNILETFRERQGNAGLQAIPYLEVTDEDVANAKQIRNLLREHAQQTPLRMAVQNGKKLKVKKLLEKAFDPNERDSDGRTLFHAATLQQNPAIIRLLNREGANVEIRKMKSGELKKTVDGCDVYGQTPLHLAVELNAQKVVEALLKIGALPNRRTRNNQKLTALHIAVNKGNFEIVRALLDAGANLNIPDDNGLTALHHANNILEIFRGQQKVTDKDIIANAQQIYDLLQRRTAKFPN
jgi:ankyrin repeat protein